MFQIQFLGSFADAIRGKAFTSLQWSLLAAVLNLSTSNGRLQRRLAVLQQMLRSVSQQPIRIQKCFNELTRV
jgi:hypothetical protein